MPRVNGTVSVGSLAGRFRSVNGRRTHCAYALAWRATPAGSCARIGSRRQRARGEDGRPCPPRLLRDVGHRVIGQGDERVHRLVARSCWRPRRARLGRSQPQVLENAPDDARVVDQGDDWHEPLALRTLQGIGLVDFADEARPGAHLLLLLPNARLQPPPRSEARLRRSAARRRSASLEREDCENQASPECGVFDP
jgi:hypothetical protein